MRSTAVLLAALAVATGIASGAAGSTSASTARCAAGTVPATVSAKRVCLRRGQRCATKLDRQYHRYGFHCHGGRLSGGPAPKLPVTPAGTVAATIPAPSTGGIGIGAGAVWVANTLANTVTRIDPQTNRVVATIPTGRSPEDLFHGPTRVAVGHGAVWVADGRSDCSCVHRIDPVSNGIIKTIRLGTPTFPEFRLAPLGIAVTPDAVWIALRHGREEDALAGSVVRVDPVTNEVVAVVPLGSSTDGGGPTRIAAGAGAVWVGIPSSRTVVRIDPETNSVMATIPGLTCGEGELAADDSGGVWVADCDAVRRIDQSTNGFSRTVKIPSPTLSNGTRGLAFGLGYVWAQADVLARIHPVTGAIHGTLELDPALVWGEYSVATGFGSVWVRQIDRVVRIDP